MDYPSMYQAAVQYIKMGLAVFPLEERGKRPKTRNGFKDATTDAAQVKAWWQQWPNANIGIATGKRSGGIVVIDTTPWKIGKEKMDISLIPGRRLPGEADIICTSEVMQKFETGLVL